MKPGHTYAINPPRRKKRRAKRAKNPVPFSMIVANSPGSKRPRRKRRNPARAKTGAGVFVIRGPKKNPSPMKTKRRRNSHRRKKKFNLLGNLGLFAKKRRNPRRRRKARRNPTRKIFSTMSKTKRRGSRRRHRKNPAGGVMRRNGRRRRSHRRRNSGFRRNPIPVVKELFTSDNLATVAGVLLGSAGAQTVINYAQGANAAGQRRFSLPGVNYTNAQNSAMFYSDNAWILAGMGGFLLKGQSPRLARGVMLGGLVGAASDILSNTGFLAGGAIQLSRLGVSRNFGGVGYLPGTNTQFTNPAQRFLANGNVPRPGMGARVGPRMVGATESQVEGAYKGAN